MRDFSSGVRSLPVSTTRCHFLCDRKEKVEHGGVRVVTVTHRGDVFRGKLVGGVRDEEASFTHSTITHHHTLYSLHLRKRRWGRQRRSLVTGSVTGTPSYLYFWSKCSKLFRIRWTNRKRTSSMWVEKPQQRCFRCFTSNILKRGI